MLCIAGQRAGPIGLKFFVNTHGWPGVLWAKKIETLFFNIFFHWQRRALQLVTNNVVLLGNLSLNYIEKSVPIYVFNLKH